MTIDHHRMITIQDAVRYLGQTNALWYNFPQRLDFHFPLSDPAYEGKIIDYRSHVLIAIPDEVHCIMLSECNGTVQRQLGDEWVEARFGVWILTPVSLRIVWDLSGNRVFSYNAVVAKDRMRMHAAL